MLKVVTIIGARPQIIKAAAINRAIRNKYADQIKEVIVHTGQHYDETMSQVFFKELDLPSENYNLEVGSGSHASQTALMMVRIEDILLKEKPACVLLYGDTNSTLAASVTSAKLHIPVIHVEGGVRSFNKKFPEEVNRLICDHLSTLIFVPTLSGMDNMLKEGFKDSNSPPYSFNNPGVFYCGDIMYDNALYFSEQAEQRSDILKSLALVDKPFALVTMHRPSNVDDPATLERLLNVFNQIAKERNLVFVFPMHPRTLKMADSSVDASIWSQIKSNPFVKVIPPVSFINMILLEKKSSLIVTDSGGVQKEAYYFHKPCVILLDETPWPELVASGSALLTGSDPEQIKKACAQLLTKSNELSFKPIFGDGDAAEFICKKIIENFS